MNYFIICVIIGIILFIFAQLIMYTGGATGSQFFRDRMTAAGSDLQKKRLRDLGLEPEKKDN